MNLNIPIMLRAFLVNLISLIKQVKPFFSRHAIHFYHVLKYFYAWIIL